MFISVAVGLIVAAVLFAVTDWRAATKLLIGWDIGVGLYLVLSAILVARSDVHRLKRRAANQDEGSLALLFLIVAAAVASLGAIFAELAMIERADPHYAFYVTLAIATVVLSWTFTHTIFALHYAHDYYGGRHKGGLRFPEERQPDYWDFIYFAFVVGMTFQVSDVAVTQKSIRRMVVAHGALSFFFTAAIIAMTVNIAANVIQK